VLLDKAHEILRHAADAVRLVREVAGPASQILRIGAIDSAAAGLLPALLYDFHARYPAIDTRLVESKSAQILPMLAAGRLDLGFVRPPVQQEGIAFEHLFDETPVAVLPQKSRLASRKRLRLQDLADLPLILPPRHTRPHSFGVVMRLFASLGVKPNVVQEAEEKQTIVNLVAAGLGVALLPEWMGRMRVPGVVYRPIDLPDTYAIPEWALGVAWLPDVRCAPRDRFLALVRDRVAAPRRSPPGAP
jgi:DNA-binding transcriptional LysR family regulator